MLIPKNKFRFFIPILVIFLISSCSLGSDISSVEPNSKYAMTLGIPKMEYGSCFNPYQINLTHINGIKNIYADVISKQELL